MAFLARAIRKQGNRAIGVTFCLSKMTLAQMGGLDTFKDHVLEDMAMGMKAHDGS